MKAKERLENWSRLKENEEAWWLNAVSEPTPDPLVIGTLLEKYLNSVCLIGIIVIH